MHRIGYLLLLVLLAIPACRDTAGPNHPAKLEVVDGDGQTGRVGAALARALTVRVSGADGRSVGGVMVKWTIPLGEGRQEEQAVPTDGRGLSSPRWTLPHRAGSYVVTAAVGGLPSLAFRATATPGEAAHLVFTDTVSGVVEEESARLSVRVTDRFDNPLPAARVTWRSGDTATAVVDSAGTVRGLRDGTAHIVASVDSLAVTRKLPVLPRIDVLSVAFSPRVLMEGVSRPAGVTLWSRGRYVHTGRRVIAWSSSDTAVAVVDTAGRVTARRAGSALVRATVDGVSDTVRVHVEKGVASIRIGLSDPIPGTVFWPGVRRQITATAHDREGAPMVVEKVLFSGSDPSVLEVDSATVRALRGGASAYLRASAGGRTDSIRIASAEPFRASVVALGRNGCFLDAAGRSYCWGSNDDGMLGIGRQGLIGNGQGIDPPPVYASAFPVAQGLSGLTSIAVGAAHVCALAADGTVSCWGSNTSGQLGMSLGVKDCRQHVGLGMGTRFWECALTPVPAFPGTRFGSIAVGGSTTCGIVLQGGVVCAGRVPFPTGAGGLRSVAVGVDHACGLDAEGAAFCWGSNQYGQTGAAGAGGAAAVRVAGGHTFRELDAGDHHTCGRTARGEVYCWGANRSGQLGIGALDTLPHLTPTRLAGGTAFASLDAGGSSTCAVTTAGAAHCWGSLRSLVVPGATRCTSSGPLCGCSQGYQCAAEPLELPGEIGWRAVDAQGCGVSAQGMIHCWSRQYVFARSASDEQMRRPEPVPGQLDP